MPLIPFPNIPDLPGVPAIPRLPRIPSFVQIPSAGTVVRAGLGIIQGALWAAFQTDTRWGIYDKDGEPLANPSSLGGVLGVLANSVGFSSTLSTASVEYSKTTRVADFPVERGHFAQYNKVESPGEATVRMAFTGSEAERMQFLDEIDRACKSVDLYDVVTPEVAYIQYSIESYGYERTAERGATLLVVELYLKEIRQVSAQYTQSGSPAAAPANPDATPPVSSGQVQAATPAPSVLQSVARKVEGLATTAINQARNLVGSVFQ